MLVEFPQCLDVRLARLEILGTEVQGHISLDGSELPGQRQLFQAGAQVLADLALDLIGVGHEFVQGAVLPQPFGRGLGSALGHSGNVVRGVAHEGQVIDDLLRPDAELLHHAIGIQVTVAHGVNEADMIVHQLGHVLVAGGHQGGHALLRRLAGQSADDVVRLNPLHHQQGQAHGLDDIVQTVDLGFQILRRRGAVGLVLVVQLIAKGLAGRIEHHRHVPGLVILDELAQHVHHPHDGPGGLAPGVGQGRQGVIGAEQVGRAVHQDEIGLLGHARLVANRMNGVSLPLGEKGVGVKFHQGCYREREQTVPRHGSSQTSSLFDSDPCHAVKN